MSDNLLPAQSWPASLLMMLWTFDKSVSQSVSSPRRRLFVKAHHMLQCSADGMSACAPCALCLLQATLFPTNPMLHPGIMYAFWSRWDGTPLTQRPVFYEGVHTWAPMSVVSVHHAHHCCSVALSGLGKATYYSCSTQLQLDSPLLHGALWRGCAWLLLLLKQVGVCADPFAAGVDDFAASVLEGEDDDLQAIRRWGLQRWLSTSCPACLDAAAIYGSSTSGSTAAITRVFLYY